MEKKRKEVKEHLKKVFSCFFICFFSCFFFFSFAGKSLDQGKMIINKKEFLVFRIGICDGFEKRNGKKHRAGEEFVFIALGWDQTGNPVWFPEPGPDYRVRAGEAYPMELLSYELLIDREKF